MRLEHMRNISTNSTTEQIYSGTFFRFGLKVDRGKKDKSNITPTICLQHIKDGSGKELCDHMWFNYTAEFCKCGQLKLGDILIFKSKPQKYHKGDWNQKTDIKLKRPRSVQLASKHEFIPMPLQKKAIVGYIMSITDHREVGTYSKAYHDWAFENPTPKNLLTAL